MPKHITQGITKVEEAPSYCFGHTPIRKCAWCKKKFEVLSPQWKYKTQRKGRIYWFCRYNCWTADEQKYNPKPVLRGEHCMENMKRYQAERLEIVRERY